MPYITQELRNRMANGEVADCPGELNYAITLLIKEYFEWKPNYQGINDIIGALEGAKLEFYRCIAGPYEDQKIALNGGVY